MMKNQHDNFCIIYVTASNEEEADKLADILVAKKLCACVNIFRSMKSVYMWQEKVEKSNEIPLFIKTKSELFDEIKSVIKENHSYDTPCIIKINIADGDQDFLNWLENSVESR